jgi:hypothetical protein
MRVAAHVRNLAIIALAVLAGCVVVDGPVAPDPGPQFCTREYAPVCARSGSDRRTFSNECEADRAGYRIIRDGECRRDRPDDPRPPRPDRPQMCPEMYAPVCARRGNDRQTFTSACHASAAGYDVIRNGECRGGQEPGRPGSVPGGQPGTSAPGGQPGSSAPGGQPGVIGGGPQVPPSVGNQPPGASGPVACTREYAPVCARNGTARQTFPNACEARAAGFSGIRPGECS